MKRYVFYFGCHETFDVVKWEKSVVNEVVGKISSIKDVWL